MDQFDRLDEIANQVRTGDMAHFGVLSTGERIYVLLVADRADLLKSEGDIVYCLGRLGRTWRDELLKRHYSP